MKKEKVIIFLDKYHHVFSRISELLSDRVEYKFMWVGHFRPGRLPRILPALFYYRVKGFRILHFHWLEMYYIDKSFLVSSFYAFILLLGLVFLKIAGYKVVWTCHNIYPHENIYPGLTRLVRRLFVKLCDYILVMHKSMISKIASDFNYKGKFKCIRGGCCFETYAGNRTDARESLNLPEGSSVIVSTGSIRRYKNLDMLVQAFSIIDSDVRNDLRLVIVGKFSDKDLADELEKLSSGIPEIFLFLKDTTIPSLGAYVAAADIMAIPQTMDGVSANLHLAASYGVPVLTTPESGGTARLVEEYGLGEICDLNVNSLSRAMEGLYKAKEKLKRYSNNAKKFIKEDSWERSAQGHLEAYKEALT
ncbi:MAG: glycosyltransferase family 4 protein [Candidatus Omnitrophota bacterium]